MRCNLAAESGQGEGQEDGADADAVGRDEGGGVQAMTEPMLLREEPAAEGGPAAAIIVGSSVA